MFCFFNHNSIKQQQNSMKQSQNTMPGNSVTIQPSLTHSTLHQKSAKTLQILKLQSQIHKMKQWIDMEIQLRQNRQQYSKVAKQIQNYEQDLKIKKRQAISQNLMLLEQKKMEREQLNKQSNYVLFKIKEQHRVRRSKMQSLVNQFKKEYEYVYHKKLSQRKQMHKVDFQAISQHQASYQQSLRKRSIRVKTQNNPHSYYQFNQHSPQNNCLYSPERQDSEPGWEKARKNKIVELVNKRKEYGNRMEKEAAHIKISLDILQKVRDDKNRDHHRRDLEIVNLNPKRNLKPRLKTNLTGDIEDLKNRQISNISKETAPVKEKLTRLRHLVDGYSLKYANGQQQALDMMCNASLARANILLSQSQS